MNKHTYNRIILLFFMLLFSIAIFANNPTCSEAAIIGAGTYEVSEYTGNGAVFQGATAAVWYRYEPTEKGVFTVSSCGGGGDTRLVVMLLDDCNQPDELQLINSADDNCADGKGGQTASTLSVVAIPNFSYVIYWDNGQSNDGFTWELRFEKEENNSVGTTCPTAVTIEVGEHTIDTLVGTGTAFSDAVSAKWYTFSPENDSHLLINACQSGVNTRLFIWKGSCELPQLIAQDDDGCGDSGASLLNNILVEKEENYYIYWDDHYSKTGFTFSMMLNDVMVSTNEPIWSNTITIFPNPVTDELFIEYDFKEKKDLEIFIIHPIGQVLFREYWRGFHKGNLSLPVQQLPKGTYFLSIKTESERLVRPFVKED